MPTRKTPPTTTKQSQLHRIAVPEANLLRSRLLVQKAVDAARAEAALARARK